MTTDYKQCLAVEGRNRIATELRIQSKLLQYQAQLMDGDEISQQQTRVELHALQDILLDSIAIQFHCIKNIPPE